jgi:predicted nucleic acid-binding protein
VVTLIDTSAWIDLLRDRDSQASQALDELVRAGDVALAEPVLMELLAGVRGTAEHSTIRRLSGTYPIFRTEDLDDWESAAEIFRVCRRKGVTITSQLDCLIAAVAIREGIPVLHADRDFDEIAKHTSLKIAPA